MLRKEINKEQDHNDNKSQYERFPDLELGSDENEVPYQPLPGSPSPQMIELDTRLESKHSESITTSLHDQSEPELQATLSELDAAIALLAFRCTPKLSISSCILLSTFSAWLAMTLATDRQDGALFATEAAGIGMVVLFYLGVVTCAKMDPILGLCVLGLMIPTQMAIINYFNDTTSNLVLAQSAGVAGGISLASLPVTIVNCFNKLSEDKWETIQAVIKKTNIVVDDNISVMSSLKAKRAEVAKTIQQIQQTGLLENSLFRGLTLTVRPETRSELSRPDDIRAKL